MFKKINGVFRPNHPGNRSRDRFRCSEDYHSACTVKLVRSTSMLVVGENGRARQDSTLKRSVSAISVESSTALFYYQSREDRVWLYSQNQDCLEYLQELVALRRQYTKSINDLKNSDHKETTVRKKKPAPRAPQNTAAQTLRPEPSAPPIPNEEDTIQFFDQVIASLATSTSEHDLHSNWVLRDPRRISMMELQPKKSNLISGQAAQRKGDIGSTGSRRRLQRNPIHLPKVVESAFQTLRFKPKLKKKDRGTGFSEDKPSKL
ncbi:hypothetical protein DNTS_027291 [Danionella cerebrum]|uniref:Uncharacterized protein n=1 Tax=Danionella cerebrum TaxID=2873325 RepID=A0A553R4K5_9TELE|nr:hypothetical protein DNTS_027291 [Danionella translucida]